MLLLPGRFPTGEVHHTPLVPRRSSILLDIHAGALTVLGASPRQAKPPGPHGGQPQAILWMRPGPSLQRQLENHFGCNTDSLAAFGPMHCDSAHKRAESPKPAAYIGNPAIQCNGINLGAELHEKTHLRCRTSVSRRTRSALAAIGARANGVRPHTPRAGWTRGRRRKS